MKTAISPLTAFIIAALWLALGVWASIVGNVPFIVGGYVLAVGFVVLGVVQSRKKRTS